MQGVYAQFEEFVVSKAVGLALHGLDLVVGPLQGGGGDAAAVIVEDAGSVLHQCFGELHQHADAAASGAGDPVIQKHLRRRSVALVPDLPKVLFHVVSDGQRFVQLQRRFQPFLLVLFFAQIFRVLQQQPACSLEHLLLQRSLGLALQFLPEQRELFVEEFDHMKAVEHMNGFGQIVAHGGGVGRGHVGRHGFDFGMAGAELFEENRQGIGPFSFAHMHHRAAVQVQHHGQVVMSAADADLIDRQMPEVLEPDLLEPPVEVRFWISLTVSQPTLRCAAAWAMVVRRERSRA